jgi:hypothetical protein
MSFAIKMEARVHKRFWGSYNPNSLDAENLSQFILELGTTMMSGEKGGAQTIIKETYKNAHSIHRYAHQLDLIIEKTA